MIDPGVSPNALAVTEQKVEAGLSGLAAAFGMSPAKAFLLAMLAAELHQAGGRLIPPLWPGAHTKLIFPTGERMSLHAYLTGVRCRWMWQMMIGERTCDQCGGHLLGAGSMRRTDTRYCSNACRQKAYRRRRNGVVKVTPAATLAAGDGRP